MYTQGCESSTETCALIHKIREYSQPQFAMAVIGCVLLAGIRKLQMRREMACSQPAGILDVLERLRM